LYLYGKPVSEPGMGLVKFDQHVSPSVVNGLFEGNRRVREYGLSLGCGNRFHPVMFG
jgi:hypothetical protein